MRRIRKLFALISIVGLLASLSFAQDPQKNKKQTVALAASSNPVVGSGTPGQITKWTGIEGSNTFTIGNSNIFEDKFGKIGIGTHTPTSLLTVQGMIETTLGGYKFPDGTVQTTAGIAFVTHDASLMGDGKSATPLGIALGGVNTIHLANAAVTAPKIANGTVVRSLNNLFDNVSLAAGANITITPSGNTLTIAAANALTGVAHDASLQGNGSGASPLGVAVPLSLSGSVAIPNAIITVTNTNTGGFVDEIGPMAVKGLSANGIGVAGTGSVGVRGVSTAGGGIGVRGVSPNTGWGMIGTGAIGVQGEGQSVGVQALGNDNSAIEIDGGLGALALGGDTSGLGRRAGAGIFARGGIGFNGATNGPAAGFNGDVDVQGKLTKTMGTFKIDHPLDPENKYLYHSFVESPDMMNIYNGNITTDQNGEAVVEMPDYFDALNKDFRYQLTVIGTFAQAIVASKMKSNRFVIKTNAPNVEVSWMVTGVRQDAYANKNRVTVEVDKSVQERGYYLHPEVFDQPEEKSIEWIRQPEMMQKLKQQRLEAEERIKKQQQR